MRHVGRKAILLAIAIGLFAGSGSTLRAQERPAAPPAIPGWIGPLDVTDELAAAKTARHWLPARAGTLTPNQAAYDFHFYDLDLHPNPAASVLTGSVRALASVVTGPVVTMELDFNSTQMTVDAVTCAGQPAAFVHANHLIQVTLDRTYQTGEMVNVRVTYHGAPNAGASGNAFLFQTHRNRPLISTLSQPYDARQWWPCKDDPSDKADSADVRVTVPSGMITASNGVLFASSDNGTTAFRHWKCRSPIATYLVSIASYEYSTFSDWYMPMAGPPATEIQFYLFPQSVNQAAAVNAKVKTMMGAFATRFGEYPFVDEKYGHAQFKWAGGMEHQTITSLDSFSESLVAHELSHQWWGDWVTCRDYHHVWLNEGFATYSEALWAEAQNGPAAYATSMAAKRHMGAGIVFVNDAQNVERIFDSDLSYRKPSWVLHMLRHVMGDLAFFDALRTYRTNFGGGTAVTEDFQQVCESVSGMNLGWFFQQWIYGEYHPQYRVAWWSAPAGAGYDVTLELGQIQTWQRFRMPVDVRIETASGTRNFVVVNDAVHVQYFTLHVDDTPTSLAIDPGNWILQTTLYYATSVTDPLAPRRLELAPPRPSPMRLPVTLSFATPRPGRVSLAIFDAAGRRAARLLDRSLEAGDHRAVWDGREGSGAMARPGIYWIAVELEGERVTRRAVLLP